MSTTLASKSSTNTSLIRQVVQSRRTDLGDKIFFGICLGAALLILVVIAGLIVELTINAWPSITKFGFGFLVSTSWNPVKENFGALPFIYGTVVSSFLALAIALPPSIGIAVFLVEIASHRSRTILSFLVETLAAVPSVVYGVWGIFVLCPFLQQVVGPPLSDYFGWIPLFSGPPYGVNMLAAGIILAIMIIPIIASISRDVMIAIPMAQREAALALGSTRWEAAKIVIANARWGILGGVVLGLGRALGETMAVTMVIGNKAKISASLLHPGYTMASVIANEFNEASSEMYTAALVEVGLVLLVITFIVNALARVLVWSVTRKTMTGASQ